MSSFLNFLYKNPFTIGDVIAMGGQLSGAKKTRSPLHENGADGDNRGYNEQIRI
jgi:hypothetical protein